MMMLQPAVWSALMPLAKDCDAGADIGGQLNPHCDLRRESAAHARAWRSSSSPAAAGTCSEMYAL